MAKKKEVPVQNETTPRKWVVDWQNKNPSVIIDLTATGKDRKERKLTGDEEKFAWVDDELQKGDELYTELGASADMVSLMAIKRGVRVLRIKTHILKSWRKERDLTSEDAFESIVYHAENLPGLFLETPIAVAKVLGLKCAVRHFEITQAMRKSEALRLRAVATMEFFLQRGEECDPETDQSTEATKVLEADIEGIIFNAREQLMEKIKGFGVSVPLRRKFMAQLTPRRLTASIVDEITGRRRAEKDTDLTIHLERAFATSHIFWGIQLEEEHYAAEIEARLEELEVYKKVFKPIPGMGPKIAGRIISSIGDLRRFETCWSLAAYYGYHVRADGSCPRRRKAIASPDVGEIITNGSDRRVDFGGWNKLGRQGLFLWAEQVNKANPKRGAGLMPFKELLVGRKAYISRKSWIAAAQEVKKGGQASAELIDFIDAMEMACEAKNSHGIPNWFYDGKDLLEDERNPYLIVAHDLRVMIQPWQMRDALKELLKPKEERKEFPLLPDMEISKELKKEITRFCKCSHLSKKRLQQGSYRWLINNVLIRKYIWPDYREFLGLPKDLDPRKSQPSPQQEVSASDKPVRYGEPLPGNMYMTDGE